MTTFKFDFGESLSRAMLGEEDEPGLMRRSYEYFAPRVIKSEDTGDFIKLQSFQLEVIHALESDAEMVLIILPRGFTKTVIVTIGYTAWEIGNNPNLRCIIASNTEDQATSHLGGIDGLLRDPDYQSIFGDLIGDPKMRKVKWTEDTKFVKRSRAMRHPTLYGTGVGGAGVTGKRSDRLLVDDLIDQAHALSATERERAWTWFTGALSYTKVPGARTIVVNTRYHPEDIAGRLMEQYRGAKPSEFVVVDIPALIEDVDGEQKSIWEERFPTEWLKREQTKNYYQFSAHFMNNPLDLSKSQLSESWLNYESYSEVKNLFGEMEFFAGVDPNTAREDIKKDYFAVAIVGVHPGTHRVYVVDLMRVRLDLAQTKAMFQAKMSLWKPTKIMLESNAAQVLFETLLNDNNEYLNYPFQRVYSTLKKEERILGMAAHFMAGKVSVLGERDSTGTWHPIPSLEPLRYEWILFPHSDTHFDALDALDMALKPVLQYVSEAAISVINSDEFGLRMASERENRGSLDTQQRIKERLLEETKNLPFDVGYSGAEDEDSEPTPLTAEELDTLEDDYLNSFKPHMPLGTIRRNS